MALHLRLIPPLVYRLATVFIFLISIGHTSLRAQVPDASDFVFDAQEAAQIVYKLFERSCAECHDGASRSRSKGGFGTVMDFDAMRADPFMIDPENVEDSELYWVITDPDPEFVMPPPDSDCPQLTEIEASLVKFWIESGAPSPKQANETIADGQKEDDVPTHLDEDKTLSKLFAKLHPMVVHFPIALVWTAFLAALWGAFIQKKGSAWVILWCLTLASFFSLLAGATGWILADISGYADETVWNHRASGIAVTIGSILSLALHLLRIRKPGKAVLALFWICLIAGVIAASSAGHTGGELIYGEETFFNILLK